jgi:hypothetical protein
MNAMINSKRINAIIKIILEELNKNPRIGGTK